MAQSLFVLILGWYLFSITLSLYNKWMFDPHRGLQISCPIMITAFHQLVLWLLSYFYVRYRRRNSRDGPELEPDNDWKFCLRFIVPTAIATAGDIGFGNVSFKFVPLTIYTIIKSASIAFVLLFGCMFKLEQFHWKLALIVLIMFVGVVLMVLSPSNEKEPQEHSTLIFGSLLVVASSCLSGLRWVFTQLILRRTAAPPEGHESLPQEQSHGFQVKNAAAPKPHPIFTIHQLSPIMGVVLFFAGLIVERPFPGLLNSQLFSLPGDASQHSVGSVLKGVMLLVIPGIEVFFMTICEFAILQAVHVLTLSIAGIVKEVLTILLGMLLLGERLSGLHNWTGMSIILLDVVYYNYFRYKQDQESVLEAEKRHSASSPQEEYDDFEELIPPPISQDYELDLMATDSTKAVHHAVN